MPNLRADDLSPLQREVIEGILGRALAGGENVELHAYVEDRHRAQRKVMANMDEMAAMSAGASEQEVYALIDEAIQHARHGAK